MMKNSVIKKFITPAITALAIITLALYSLGAFDDSLLEVINYTDPAGGSYSGVIIDGKYEGYGTLSLSSGDLYIGNLRAGIMNAQGHYISVNNWEYSGGFAEGRPSGKGIFKTVDGSEYSGDFRLGDITGDGNFKSKSGWSFNGSFKDGEFVKGELILKNGSSYNGTFKDNIANGDGIYFHRKDGELLWKYEGGFVDGMRQGKGVRKTYSPKGKLILTEKGEWLNGAIKK